MRAAASASHSIAASIVRTASKRGSESGTRAPRSSSGLSTSAPTAWRESTRSASSSHSKPRRSICCSSS
eukprot:2961857-Pleurochrysis_carterae.AAC.1